MVHNLNNLFKNSTKNKIYELHIMKSVKKDRHAMAQYFYFYFLNLGFEPTILQIEFLSQTTLLKALKQKHFINSNNQASAQY